MLATNRARKGATLAVSCVGFFMVLLDASIVSASRQIGSVFGVALLGALAVGQFAARLKSGLHGLGVAPDGWRARRPPPGPGQSSPRCCGGLACR
jgi:hypothetical protein